MVYEGRRRSSSAKRNYSVNIRGKSMAVRMVVSLWVLFIAAMIKILFPQASAGLQKSIAFAIGSNVDYKSAMRVMADAAKGEVSLLRAIPEAWSYAFDISGDNEVQVSLDENGDDPVIYYVPSGEDTANEAFEAPEQNDGEAVFAELPENISDEAPELPFEYVLPVDGEVLSKFGYRQRDDGEQVFHHGIDISAAAGAEVVSFADGKVSSKGESNTYGLYIIVDHSDGVQTMYAHLQNVCVNTGGQIKMGEKIGEVGITAKEKSPYLHFEVIAYGKYVDPETYVFSSEKV